MNKIFCSIGLFLLLLLSGNVHAALNVFACEPEWAALTQQLAGDKARHLYRHRPAAGPAPGAGAPQPDCQSAQGGSGGVHRRGTGNRLDAGGTARIRQ